MKEQKDRHLEAPGEANRDKHINFLARENGDADPADEKFDIIDDDEDDNETDEADSNNGFFTDDNNTLQTKEESESSKRDYLSEQEQKVTPLKPDEQTTLGDKISIDTNNDILTPVKNEENMDY